MAEGLKVVDLYNHFIDKLNFPKLYIKDGSSRARLDAAFNEFAPDEYRGSAAIFHETDYEHHEKYALVNLTDVKLNLSGRGLRCKAKFDSANCHEFPFEVIAQVHRGILSKDMYDKVRFSKPKTISDLLFYNADGCVDVVPEESRSRMGPIAEELFLIMESPTNIKFKF